MKSRPYLRYSVIIKTHTANEKKKSSELNIMARCLPPRRTSRQYENVAILRYNIINYIFKYINIINQSIYINNILMFTSQNTSFFSVLCGL